MRQNITVSLDQDTLQLARELAARRNLSVSKLLAADLSEQVDADRHYDQARRQAQAWLNDAALDLGNDYLPRQAAHDR